MFVRCVFEAGGIGCGGGEVDLSLIKIQIVYIMFLVNYWYLEIDSRAALSEDEGHMQPAGCQLPIPDLGQCIFASNSHTICHTFKIFYPQTPWMELNHFAVATHTSAQKVFFRKFAKPGKPTFSNSSLGFCPICVKLGTYTLQLDLI